MREDSGEDFFVAIRTMGAGGRGTALPRPLGVGLQTMTSAAYYRDARSRRDRNHVIFQYTLSGEGRFSDASGVRSVPSGAAFLCESHDPAIAYYYPPDSSAPWRFLFVALSGRMAHILCRDVVRRFGHLFNLSRSHPVLARLKAFGLHREGACMLALSDGVALAMGVMEALLRSTEGSERRSSEHRLVRLAHEAVWTHMAEPLSVSALARLAGVSREHLTRVFRSELGLSPHRYVVQLRMQTACSLLKSSALSVKEVAFRMGFGSSAEFCRLFRVHLRMTPTAFRRSGMMPLLPVDA